MQSEVSIQYAKALYELVAEEEQGLFLENLQVLAEALNHPKVQSIFNHPQVSTVDKQQMLAEILENRVDGLFLAFINVLIDNKRLGMLPDIATAFQWFLDEAKELLDVHAYSRFPLGPAEKNALSAQLQGKYRRTIRLHEHHAPDVLGGVRLEIGKTVIDSSLQGRLDSLKENLLKG